MKLSLEITSGLPDIAIVGSSVFGNLLKPKDVDIAVSFQIPFLRKRFIKCLRIGKYNIILLHNKSIEDYTANFDMSIVRGCYKSILTGKLTQSLSSEVSISNKYVRQLERDDPDWGYGEPNTLDQNLERAIKYIKKIPKGYRFFPLNKEVYNQLKKKLTKTQMKKVQKALN